MLRHDTGDGVVHRHHGLVLAGDKQHLLAHDDARQRLTQILDHLASVYPVRDNGLALLDVVYEFDLAALVAALAQAGVLDMQPVRQEDAALRHRDNTVAPDGRSLAAYHRLQRLPRLLPQFRDTRVSRTIYVDNTLALFRR